MPESSSNSGSENKQFGGFQIIEKVGEGGMGIIYRARQLSLNRSVALKILPQQLTADPTFVETFRKESLAAAMLHHPNLISVFDAGEADGMHYYAMEFVEGETLQQLLTRDKALPETSVLQIASCVASALKFGWDKAQLIHRDVKPANIMIGRDGNVKLCDLGLAKRFGENTMLSLSGVSYGTPHYVSPEQAKGESHIDQRSDLYSLGMTVYHALTGQVPFPATTAAAVMARHLTEQLPDPREFAPSLSTGACRLLEKMLGRDPLDRYQNWDTLLADLQRVMQGQIPHAQPPPLGKSTLHRNPKFEVRVSAAAPQQPSPYLAPRRPRMNYSTILTLIVAAILIALIVGVLDHRHKNPIVIGPNPPSGNNSNSAKSAAELLKNAEWFAAANPDKTAETIAAFRKIVADHEHTPAAETATAHLARMAAKQFEEATQFAAQNPNDYDGIIARFKRVASDFPESPFAKSAQERVNRAQNDRHTRVDGQRALDDAVKFAAANPQAFEQIVSRFEKVAQVFHGADAGTKAQALAEEWRETQKNFAAEQDAQRLAEEQKRQEEDRRAEQAAREKQAMLRAEAAFVTFGRQFYTHLRKRDYAGAETLTKTSLADAVFKPLQGRMQACLEVVQTLQAFWSSLNAQLAPLKGQEITLRGSTGKFEEVTTTGITLERKIGDTVASIEVPSESISSADWLALLNRATEKAPADRQLAFALFTFAEGRMDVVNFYLDRAKTNGANVEPARAVLASLQRVPQEEAATESLADLRRCVERSDWIGARNRLDAIKTKFSASPIIQAAREEIELLDGRITRAERELAETEAARYLAEFKRVVHNKQWNTAADILTRLTAQYAQTQVMTQTAAELEPLKKEVEVMTGQVPPADEDKDKRDLVKRRGGRILIVNSRARANERGPAGEPMYSDLSQAFGEARQNDGIEVWEGLYKVGSSDKPLPNVLIYGKAGAMPVIQQRDPAGWFPKMFTVGDGVQLESLCLVSDTFSGDGNLLFFRGQDNKSCTVRLRNCVVIGGGAFLFEGGNKSVIELEDTVLLNFHRLIEFGRVATMRLQNSALVNFSRMFNAHENAEVVLNLFISETVFANGLLCEELPMRNGPWGGNWGGRRWQWRDWIREREAQTVLRQKVAYRGDRNVISNANGVVFRVPGEENATITDWRQIFFGQDVLTLDIDARNPLDVFANAAQGDFRLRPDTRALRIGADGGSPGPRWQLWRWKAFQESVNQYNLRLAAPR